MQKNIEPEMQRLLISSGSTTGLQEGYHETSSVDQMSSCFSLTRGGRLLPHCYSNIPIQYRFVSSKFMKLWLLQKMCNSESVTIKLSH